MNNKLVDDIIERISSATAGIRIGNNITGELQEFNFPEKKMMFPAKDNSIIIKVMQYNKVSQDSRVTRDSTILLEAHQY